jgi:hypothetical protein
MKREGKLNECVKRGFEIQTLISGSLGTHRFQRAGFGGRRIDWNQTRRNTSRLHAPRVLPMYYDPRLRAGSDAYPGVS